MRVAIRGAAMEGNGTGPRGTGDWNVAVVVPARNEERLIHRCLTALDSATVRLRAERPRTRVRTVVVLDACTDATAQIVARFPGVTALPIEAGRVGVARDKGVAHVAGSCLDPRRSWIASTDADSEVPDTWLVDQLAHADTGVELLTGFVATDLSDAPDEVRDLAPTETHILDGHPYVYGANLGFTLHTYLAVGGFPPLPAHEDVAFVERARRHDVRCHASGSVWVLTSGRLDGRTPEGYAAYLRTLAHPDLVTATA